LEEEKKHEKLFADEKKRALELEKKPIKLRKRLRLRKKKKG